jgi:hypothetical protein
MGNRHTPTMNSSICTTWDHDSLGSAESTKYHIGSEHSEKTGDTVAMSK